MLLLLLLLLLFDFAIGEIELLPLLSKFLLLAFDELRGFTVFDVREFEAELVAPPFCI